MKSDKIKIKNSIFSMHLGVFYFYFSRRFAHIQSIEPPQKMEFHEVIAIFGIILAVCFGIMVLSFLLFLLGFTPAGVVAKSCAAGWQSSIGNVVKGSMFAIMQSIAALGYLANCAVLAKIVAIGTIAALIYYLFYYHGGAWPLHGNWTETIQNYSTVFLANVSEDIKNLQINLTSISHKVEEELEPHFGAIPQNVTSLWNKLFHDN